MTSVDLSSDDAGPMDLAALQAEIADGVLAGLPLAVTTEAVCRLVERALPGTRASIRTRNHRARTLSAGAGPSLSARYRALFDPQRGSFSEAELTELGAARSCAWYEDMATDPAWAPVRDELRREGLAAAYRVPALTADARLRALIWVYWPEKHWPTVGDRRVVHLAAVLMNLAVQHDHARQALDTAASRDPLTDLPNRTLFVDRLRQALARSRRHRSGVAVLFLDLDRFKVINDSLGHAAGDRLLLAAAARLSAAVRPGDTVARFGGDEFTVLCEEVDDVDVAWSLGQRLAEELSKPFVVAQRRFFVTASMGIALGGVGSRPQELIRDADVAMYRSKERGRNRIEVYDSRLRVRTLQRLDDEADLRRDLDAGAITLHYQPVFDLRTRRPVGMEALLRWRRPGGEVVDPRELIGIAEEAGLIHRLGSQVVGRACDELRALLDAGVVDETFTVAVNLAASQLSDAGLADQVAEHLGRRGLRAGQLVLEITEASLAEDRSDRLLQLLRQLGVGLWIDDFGTGYSSLARLPELPVTGLKVDVPNVAGPRQGSDGLSLLQAVVHLADALALPVIAEGIEDAAQLAQLRQLGVGAGQGWYLARPGPPEELSGLLTAAPPGPAGT